MKQPDVKLLLPVAGENIKITGMLPPVSFNHKFHEEKSGDCRSCHHKKIGDCVSCHPLEGNESGNHTTLFTVMHSREAKQSCIGCHESQKQKSICLGCHSGGRHSGNSEACVTCHTKPAKIGLEQAEDGSLLRLPGEEATRLAQSEAERRAMENADSFTKKSIPEKVVINILSNENGPVHLPHGKIIETLRKSLKGDRLVDAFHVRADTLCQGCHHNSGRDAWNPSKCASCHGSSTQISKNITPNLKDAYHAHCTTCHEALQQQPLSGNCEGCHQKRRI
jgi:hypothetical protein